MIRTKLFYVKLLVIGLAIVIMLGFYFKDYALKTYKTYTYGTYSNPEAAVKEVKIQLNMISRQLNKGISTVNYINEIEDAISIIFKVNK